MPDSYKDYEDNINENTPSVSFTNTDFEYLETAHIKVVATNVTAATEFTYAQADDGSGSEDIVLGTDGTNPPFTVTVSNGTTTVTFGNITFPTGTNKLRVKRVTPRSSLLTTFNNASLLRADDLNNNSKQLLFTLQEQVDIGIGSLPLDADNKFNAGTKAIKNLIDPVGGTEAATKAYVDALTSFSTNPTSVAQSYSFTIGDMTVGAGTTKTKALSPLPLSSTNEMFIVSIQGVLQAPNTDYTVSSGGVFTLLNGQDSGLNTGDTVVILCFGNSKSVFEFPVTGTAASASETPMTLKGASVQSEPIFKVVDSADGNLLRVLPTGTLECASFNSTGAADVDGSLNVDGTLTVDGTSTLTGNTSVGGTLNVTGTTTVQDLTVSGNATIAGLTTLPVGAVTPFAGANAPTGYVLCNGQPLDRNTYQALFDVIGVQYGAGDGVNTFNVPDMRNRFPIGTATNNLASTGNGEITLSEANLPPHTHDDGTFKARDHKHHVVANTQVSGAGPALSSTTQLPQARTTGGNTEYGFRSTSTGATIGRSSIPIEDGSKVNSSGQVDVTGDSGSTGSGTPFVATPAFLSLNYIIKT